LAGSGEAAVRDLLYVFAVSNDLMAEMTERVDDFAVREHWLLRSQKNAIAY